MSKMQTSPAGNWRRRILQTLPPTATREACPNIFRQGVASRSRHPAHQIIDVADDGGTASQALDSPSVHLFGGMKDVAG